MCEIYLRHSPDAKCAYCKYIDISGGFTSEKECCTDLKIKVNINKLGCPDFTFCQKHYKIYQKKFGG